MNVGFRRRLCAPLTIALALGAVGAVRAQQPFGTSAASLEATAAADAGRRIYVMSCQRCHGLNLVTNGIGFDLRQFPRDDKERFVRSVTHGVRAMPAWGSTLKPEQINQVWAYVGAVNGWQ